MQRAAPPSPPPTVRWTVPVLALVLLAATLQLLALLVASPGMHGYEEQYNAAHAELIRHGGLSLDLPLQYRPFCGGCSADALLGAGIFALLGPSIQAWRLVGLGFFLLALLCGAALARRISGPPGAAATALLFACAPPAYQELAQISNGNHPEGGAILLAQLLLASLAVAAGPGWRRELRFALLALLVGLGFFFLRSLALGGAVLGLALLLAPPRGRFLAIRGLSLAGGLALGAAPLAAVRSATGSSPLAEMYLPGEWSLSLRWAGHNLATLLHPLQLRGIWGDVAWPQTGGLAILAFCAWLVLALWLAISGVLGFRDWLRLRKPLQGPRATGLLAASAFGAFVVLYSLYRLSVGMDGASAPFPQQLRYLGLVYPLALVLAGAGAGTWWRRLRAIPPSPRRALGILALAGCLAALALPGLLGRARTLGAGEPLRPWRKLAPDWCWQAEQVQGTTSVLRRASAGAPLDQEALLGGFLAADQGFVLTSDAQLPASCDEGDADRSHAWAWGQAMAVMMRARDEAQGERAMQTWLALLRERMPRDACSPLLPPQRAALYRAAWCHGQGPLQQGAYALDVDPVWLAGETAQESDPGLQLWSLARGLGAGRSCHSELGDDALHMAWEPGCAAWLEGVRLEALGWGMGVSLAELQAGRLQELFVETPTLDSQQVRELAMGFERGWAWGAENRWLPERLPQLEVRWMGLEVGPGFDLEGP